MMSPSSTLFEIIAKLITCYINLNKPSKICCISYKERRLHEAFKFLGVRKRSGMIHFYDSNILVWKDISSQKPLL